MTQEKHSVRIGFLASHNGTAFRNILENNGNHSIHVIPTVLITNNNKAPCLNVAKQFGVPAFVINSAKAGKGNIDRTICDCLKKHETDFVILAGYMKKIGPITLQAFPNKILNSHPALLPKFGGKGMYGRNVHEAVIAAGEKKSGATVHLVTEEYDTGPIITQISIPISENETAEILEGRIKALEADAYLQALAKLKLSPKLGESPL